jgi:hypothetical protein
MAGLHTNAASGDCVDVGRCWPIVPVTAEVIGAERVDVDVENVHAVGLMGGLKKCQRLQKRAIGAGAGAADVRALAQGMCGERQPASSAQVSR